MAGENAKSNQSRSTFKGSTEREREKIHWKDIISQTNLSMKKNPLHGKQLDKQKAAKRNPEIQILMTRMQDRFYQVKNEDVYQISFT